MSISPPNTSIEPISCPNCGAPLHEPPSQDSWFCVYCNSLLRVYTDPTPVKASLERSLDAEAMNAVKQLIISGQRQAAIDRFQELSGMDLEQAQQTIERIAADLTVNTVFHQQLTSGGIATVVGSLVVLPASLLGWWLGWINPSLALFFAALSAFLLFTYGRGALTTLRYRNAPVAPATTLHFTQIGKVQRGRLRLRTFLILLEVKPKDGSAFQTKVVIPVREENVDRVQKGEVIHVKYLPGNPDSVIFHQV